MNNQVLIIITVLTPMILIMIITTNTDHLNSTNFRWTTLLIQTLSTPLVCHRQKTTWQVFVINSHSHNLSLTS